MLARIVDDFVGALGESDRINHEFVFVNDSV